MRRGRAGMTLVEVLVMVSLGVLIMGILWKIYQSSARQEKQLSRHLDMQRGLRGSMAVVQHDLRELVSIDALERDPSGTLLKFEFTKFHEGAPEQVRYELLHPPAKHLPERLEGGEAPPGEDGAPLPPNQGDESGADRAAIQEAIAAARGTAVIRTFLGREERLFEESIIDFKIHPFRHADEPGNPPVALKEMVEWTLLDYFQIRMTFVPGKEEFATVSLPRTLNFLVYPRLPASKRKAVYGRFRLGDPVMQQRKLDDMIERQ